MRLVHYFKRMNLEDGGVVRCVLDLTTTLAAAGHEVVLLTSDATDCPDDWNAQTAGTPAVVLLPHPSAALHRFDAAALKQVSQALHSADALHLHAMWEPTNTQVAHQANSLNIPYAISTHGMLDDWSMSQRRLKKRIYHAMFEKRLLSGAAAVHCTAQGELDQAKRWFPERLGRVVPLVFDLAPYEPGPGPDLAKDRFPGFDSGNPTVVFMSRLHVKKGVEHIIDAAKLLADRGNPASFLIAGTGEPDYVESLKQRAINAGVQDCCHFLGMVSGDDKISLLQAADCSALPTSQENFGFAIVEAMAAGTPVITTRGVDIYPELETSGGAILIEQAAQPLADAITALTADAPKLAAMSAAARDWTRTTFGGDAIANRYLELYANLASAGTSAKGPPS